MFDKILHFLNCWIFCIYTYVLVYIVSAWFSIQQLIQKHHKPKLESQEGHVALITGGGRGIGFETAIQLLDLGMHIFIFDICDEKSDGIVFLKHKGGKKFNFIRCDLSSLKSVRKAVQRFSSFNSQLHLLINNAGIMFAPRRETVDGFESHFAINYLSHFLLTHLLLSNLSKSSSLSKPSRIVNLSSCLHYPGTIKFDDIHGRICYSAEAAYCQSKLAMAIFSNMLNRKINFEDAPVLANSVHPAVAFSQLYENMWWANYLPSFGKHLLKTPSMAADTVLHAAVSPDVKSGGNFYDNCQPAEPSVEARNSYIQERLWKFSCELTGINKFGKP